MIERYVMLGQVRRDDRLTFELLCLNKDDDLDWDEERQGGRTWKVDQG